MSGEFDDLAARFQADRNSAALDKERQVQEQRLLDNHSAGVWLELSKELNRGRDSINKSSNFLMISGDTTGPSGGDREALKLRYDRGDGKPRSASVEFSWKTHVLKITGGNAANQDYKLVVEGTDVVFSFAGNNYSPFELAKDILERLL